MKTIFLLIAALLLPLSQLQAAESSRHIQILAASCAACHGPNGNSVGGTPVLAGLDRTYFIQQMQVFRDGGRPATVMQQHAKGLTSQEVEQLADYFSAQPRVTAISPLPLRTL